MVFKRLQTILQNSGLLLRCYARALFSGKANKDIGTPRAVLIIQRGQFGDMIVTTSMFRAIKKTYPNCRIGVVGNAINKKVLEGNPDVDEYIIWNDNNIEEMINQIKKGAYDFGCVTGPSFQPLVALYLAGVPRIAAPFISNGWSPYETRPYKMILGLVIKKEHRMKQYVPREFLKLLEPIGINTTDTKKYIYWTPAAEAKAKEIISEIREPYKWLVGIMPGAGNKVKQWPITRFAEIADYLVEKYDAHVIIVGGKGNRLEIDEMLTAVRNKERLTDTSYTSVDEVKALVSKLDLTVSVDTGPIFIAEASGVPTIDIAGSIHPGEMAPNDGKLHLVVTSEGEPEIWTMNATVFNYGRARQQVESITVKQVKEKIDELIAKINK